MQGWSVAVDLDRTDDTITREQLDAFTAALDGWHASVGFAPTRRLSARISVDEEGPREALDAALTVVVGAAERVGVSGPVLGVDVVTEEELERRLAA